LPMYPLTDGITQNFMRKLVLNVFSQYAAQISENLPDNILSRHRFPERRAALQKMHFCLDTNTADKVRVRFAYEELFYSQILWARHRVHHDSSSTGIEFTNKRQHTTALKGALPFALTGAQKRVIREIFADMTSSRQMSRLVQGDVGSGKTIVTLFAMLLAVENGYQAALMAPTEILADQHYQNFLKLLGEIPIQVILLKGGNYKGKAEQKRQISSGEAHLIIGTHALIQKDVEYYKLGFIAIDEQHRFGVEQRALLARREPHPELLYLSATPIPRSLALTLYGDMEVSQIDEMPPNRKDVITYIRSDRKLDSVYQAVRTELQKGRQAYFVCPLVEESDKVDLVDAERLFQHLSRKVYPEFPCQLIHGRMPNASKDEIMRSFKAGEIKVLVSTTVIEVGVDVANATVMVVEHAERFGLAQLHQLRGRVGRGADQAFCYLIEHQPLSSMARERLATMSRTNDGFTIAEKDLELRGPGELFGLEQSGMPRFRFANLVKDQMVLRLARADAFEIVQTDPELNLEEHALVKKIYLANYAKKEELILY
ncbi:MAG TPA: ATP-dependent DNA helicase RecG, partial [Candidatus Cloacimonadota bacterium]|nr:ATP-dependent DNA helicase RecG [Candidatus Cloacimonadota bacterium]